MAILDDISKAASDTLSKLTSSISSGSSSYSFTPMKISIPSFAGFTGMDWSGFTTIPTYIAPIVEPIIPTLEPDISKTTPLPEAMPTIAPIPELELIVEPSPIEALPLEIPTIEPIREVIVDPEEPIVTEEIILPWTNSTELLQPTMNDMIAVIEEPTAIEIPGITEMVKEPEITEIVKAADIFTDVKLPDISAELTKAGEILGAGILEPLTALGLDISAWWTESTRWWTTGIENLAGIAGLPKDILKWGLIIGGVAAAIGIGYYLLKKRSPSILAKALGIVPEKVGVKGARGRTKIKTKYGTFEQEGAARGVGVKMR